MNISQQLAEFGLNQKQAEIYLALLELGTSSMAQIAKKASIKRTTGYDLLLDLEKRGLVGQTKKGKKRLFFAQSPENLGKALEEKKKRLEELLPALKSLFNTAGSKPIIRYFEGIEGIKEVYRDTLKYKGELLAFVTENIIAKLGFDFAEEYKNKRVDAQITVRAIGPDTEEIIEYQKKDQKDLKKTRLVSKENFPFSIEMNLYGNKLAFMSFTEQMGIIIESNEIAKNMRFLFELAWLGTKEQKRENLKEKEEANYWKV
jgi:sugar-specific transcriptional regulator TrmB